MLLYIKKTSGHSKQIMIAKHAITCTITAMHDGRVMDLKNPEDIDILSSKESPVEFSFNFNVPVDFFTQLNKLITFSRVKRDGVRFIIIPYGLAGISGYHAQLLIIDIRNGTYNNFEPQGLPEDKSKLHFDNEYEYATFIRLHDMLAEEWKGKLKLLGLGELYYTCPRYRNIQFTDRFCMMWVVYFSSLRILNPDISFDDLTKRADNLHFLTFMYYMYTNLKYPMPCRYASHVEDGYLVRKTYNTEPLKTLSQLFDERILKDWTPEMDPYDDVFLDRSSRWID
jgi:hypothetical protein